MQTHAFLMPALGESVDEATISRWMKSVGDRVEIGEPIVEVATDKVDTEVESDRAGVIVEILAEEGQTLPIGAEIARIGDGEAAAEPHAPSTASAPRTEARAAVATEVTDVTEVAEVAPADGAPRQAPRQAPREAPRSGSRDGQARQPFLTFLVRKLARETGVDLATIVGTGRDGRITKADVLRAAEQMPSQSERRRQGAHGFRSDAAPRTILSCTMRVLLSSIVGDGTELDHAGRTALLEAVASVLRRAAGEFPAPRSIEAEVVTTGMSERHSLPVSISAPSSLVLPIRILGPGCPEAETPRVDDDFPIALSFGAVTRDVIAISDIAMAIRPVSQVTLAYSPTVEQTFAAQLLASISREIQATTL